MFNPYLSAAEQEISARTVRPVVVISVEEYVESCRDPRGFDPRMHTFEGCNKPCFPGATTL